MRIIWYNKEYEWKEESLWHLSRRLKNSLLDKLVCRQISKIFGKNGGHRCLAIWKLDRKTTCSLNANLSLSGPLRARKKTILQANLGWFITTRKIQEVCASKRGRRFYGVARWKIHKGVCNCCMYTWWGSKGKAQSSEKTCCYCFSLTYCIGGGYYPLPFAWQEFMI